MFFSLYVLLGVILYENYGISWDEHIERHTGIVSANYIVEYFDIDFLQRELPPKAGKIPLAEYKDNVYGVAFQLPVLFLERLFGYTDTRDIFLFRHLITFLVSVAGVFALFKLAERRFSDWRIGLLGALFLILSPRLFAHSFYNSKDAVFMACFAVSIDSTVRYLLHPTKKNAGLHALITAILIDIRIIGLIIPAATVSLALLRIGRKEVSLQKTLSSLLVYSLLAGILTIAFWPFLWSDPVANFLFAFKKMAHYPWSGSVLYFGEYRLASELPWHYIPIWITITTPLLYSFFFIFGCAAIIGQSISGRFNLWRNDEELQDILFLALFFVPIITVIVTGAALYDGWRQMYFVYPPFLLIALRGLFFLIKLKPPFLQKLWFPLISVGTSVYLLFLLVWMVEEHPYQNVFFNKLVVSQNVKTQFDVDYWGLSSREALQYIADYDSRQSIAVWAGSTLPLQNGKRLLKKKERARIRVVHSEEDAEYIITNYRNNLTDYGPDGAGFEKLYEIKVDDGAIISVFVK